MCRILLEAHLGMLTGLAKLRKSNSAQAGLAAHLIFYKRILKFVCACVCMHGGKNYDYKIDI